MEKGIEIEIMGYKAKIRSVSARQADGTGIWYKEDCLLVGISFDEDVEGIAGFGVNLPVKRYEKDEFIARVKAEAEATLPKLLEKHRQEKEERRQKQEKQEVLASVVDEVKSKIDLP